MILSRCIAKFVIEPDIELIENKGFKPQDLRLAENIIEENRDVILTNWNNYFNKKVLS